MAALGLVGCGSPRDAVVAEHAATVDRYCLTCHKDIDFAGELSLESLDLGAVDTAKAEWEEVVLRLETGMMPPADANLRPNTETRAALVAWLEDELDSAASVAANAGSPPLRRVTRTEYGNAVRDLIGLEIDVTGLLPADDSTGGFDNNAEMLTITPALLERYLAAAARISAIAVGNPDIGPSASTYVMAGDASQLNHVEGLPLGTRGGMLVPHTFPLDAEYEIKIKLLETNMGAVRGLEEEHEIEVMIDGERVFVAAVGGEADFRVSARNATDMVDELDRRLRFDVAVNAGQHQVGVTFLQKSRAQGGTRLKAFERSTIDAMDHSGLPHVASLTVAGPYSATGPGNTVSRERIFICRPASVDAEPACAERLIENLASRAYRRPVSDDELARLLGLYRTASEANGFERGAEAALRAVLANPNFIFRTESERGATSEAVEPAAFVDDYELASRLSFFLWSSIPDNELISLAGDGSLGEPAIFEAQVRRLLADSRAEALVTNFAAQWLQLGNLRNTAPDKNLFPDFDDNLRQAFRRETELFLRHLIDADRSVLDLLDADYTFLNERLARHYGVSGIKGSHFRRVAVTAPERRGLLGQGSILALTSQPGRTAPVVRGKWILENLLGLELPPPPDDVPPLIEDADSEPLTVRARMESHRRDPTCSSCHRVIDPIGLALENFDAIGGWRDLEQGQPIDASGELMDGTQVDGPIALREALLAKPDVFVGHVVERLLTYALGRELDAEDMPVVRGIVRQAAESDYRISSIMLGITTSAPFRLRGKTL